MSTITLAAIEARQTELATLIAKFKAQPSCIAVPAAAIALQPGEHYAGAVLDEQGQHKHHLILMAERPDTRLDWHTAKGWAASVGGTLPDRQEQALLFANCKPHLEGEWHWSSDQYENDASCAWLCGFYYGTQLYSHKSFEGCAVAVRRA